MRSHFMPFAMAAAFCALSMLPGSSPDERVLQTHPLSGGEDRRQAQEEEFFSPRQDATKFVYNMPFYPPGKAPPGELEYDPIPFEELLPRDNTDGPQPLADVRGEDR